MYAKVCKNVCKNAAPIFQHEVLNYRFCNDNSLLLLPSHFLLWTAAHLVFNLRHLSMFGLKVQRPSHHHRKAVQLMMKSTNQLLNTLGSPVVFSWRDLSLSIHKHWSLQQRFIALHLLGKRAIFTFTAFAPLGEWTLYSIYSSFPRLRRFQKTQCSF